MWRVSLLACMACGRVGFTPSTDMGDQLTDAAEGIGDAASACPPGSLLCDDFESGDLSLWTAVVKTYASSTTAVTGTQPRSGALGLEASIPALGNGAIAVACHALPPSVGMIATRAWIYSPTQPDRYEGLMTLIDAPGCVESVPRYMLLACDTGDWYVSEQSEAGLIDQRGTACMPANTWTCVELDYTLGPNPRIQLYMNDSLVLDVAPSDPTPSFGAVLVGVARATASGYANFMDDVVISTSHIGCD